MLIFGPDLFDHPSRAASGVGERPRADQRSDRSRSSAACGIGVDSAAYLQRLETLGLSGVTRLQVSLPGDHHALDVEPIEPIGEQVIDTRRTAEVGTTCLRPEYGSTACAIALVDARCLARRR